MERTWARDYFAEDDGEMVPRTSNAAAFLSDTKDRGPLVQSQSWRSGEKILFGQTHSLRAFERPPQVQTQALRDFEKINLGNLNGTLGICSYSTVSPGVSVQLNSITFSVASLDHSRDQDIVYCMRSAVVHGVKKAVWGALKDNLPNVSFNQEVPGNVEVRDFTYTEGINGQYCGTELGAERGTFSYKVPSPFS